MGAKLLYYTGFIAALALIAVCFMPWVHYNNINETFSGFDVRKFNTGNYYGKPGNVITFFTVIIMLFMLLPKIWAKRANLFLAGLLFAYCIRTYIIFTGSLFEGEVEKRAGIYLMVILSFLVLLGTLFPRINDQRV